MHKLTLLVAVIACGVVSAQLKPSVQKPVIRKPIAVAPVPVKIKIDTRLWGFADLHAHPASHLSFGANDQGTGGMFWGKPGLALSDALATLPTDLPPCNTDSHYGFDEDPVRKATRSAIIGMMDSLTGWSHGPSGYPNFADWPNSESISHQQMHILNIRRAYDGGLRLMVASVTDNQMLSNLWTKIGFNLFGNDVPPPNSNNELASAKKQLDFINRMAAANASWMRVCRTPEEAEAAVKANKLALVLSVEMDSLSAAQILDLVHNYGVRQVIPIHLANNPNFGGSAVYEDAFNTNTKYLTGKFFTVTTNDKLRFRLSRPQEMVPSTAGSVQPVPVSDSVYASLGYNTGTGGHVNTMGLRTSEFLKLMKEGLLLDVAHMSDRSTSGAVALAELFHYPLMDSHTGLRAADGTSESERDLSRDYAHRLAVLGGVIGMGTMGAESSRKLVSATGDPIIRFTGDVHDWSRPLPTAGPDVGKAIFKMRLTLGTGGDDLRGGGDNCDVILTSKSGGRRVYANVNKSQNWGNGVRKTITLGLPPSTKVGDYVSITIHTNFHGGFDGDNWNLNEVQLEATLASADTVGTWINEASDALQVMGGRGLALGTDFNGLSPQMPFASQPIPYPMPVPPGAPAGTQQLPASKMGNRTFIFNRDGIAHYGMLPDFLCAIDRRPGGARVADALYHSADDVIQMWKKCVAASKNIH